MGKASGGKVFAQPWSLAFEERKLSFPKAGAENSHRFFKHCYFHFPGNQDPSELSSQLVEICKKGQTEMD